MPGHREVPLELPLQEHHTGGLQALGGRGCSLQHPLHGLREPGAHLRVCVELPAVGAQSGVLGKAHRSMGSISPPLHPTHSSLLWGKGCPGSSGILWVGAPVRRGVEGRLWGLWVLCEGKCGAAAPCCFSCCQPVSIPLQKHQEKKSLWANQGRFFFCQ